MNAESTMATLTLESFTYCPSEMTRLKIGQLKLVFRKLTAACLLQMFTGKVQQNSDGSFAAVNYGRNLFLGNSVKERESAVARAFDTCIVVEGKTACIKVTENSMQLPQAVAPAF